MKSIIVFLLVTFLALNSEARTPRIIGGHTAVSGQFPFAAAIHITTNDGRYFCAGTLISNQWIITAAQCVNNAIVFSIDIGAASLSKVDSNRVTLSTSEYVIHPNFNETTLENDIALIKLRMPVMLSNYILPIHTLATEELVDYTTAVVIGWGQTSDSDSSLSDNLSYIAVSALPNTECKTVYGNQITDKMVCVEGNYNEGSCHGDTGGALLRLISIGNAELVGIASFVSSNGCETTDPSGYTRLYPYMDWVNKTIQAKF